MGKRSVHVCAVVVIMFFSGITHAQTGMRADTSSKHKLQIKQEIGVQANYLIHQFFNYNKTDSIANPYYLSYKLYVLPYNVGVRLGVGYNYIRNETDFIDEARLTILRSFDMRAGLEKKVAIGRHFSAFAGADWVYSTSKNVLSTYNNIEVVTARVETYQRGGGPVAGISYRLNKHISFMTETSLYYLTGVTRHSTDFSINTNSNTSYDEKLESVVWRAPNAIFCCVNF